MTLNLPKSIFRAYDIRGIVDDALTPEVVRIIGHAIGSELIERRQTHLIVGYDGRLSSPKLNEAFCQGVNASGIEVVSLGTVTSPMLYFATHHLPWNSGVMITGSHNPTHYNGLKIVLEGKTLTAGGIQALYQRAHTQALHHGQGGVLHRDILPAYTQAIEQRIRLKRPLKVVLDCGNGIAGASAPAILEAIGCEVIPLYCEVDGRFPNHHPDPSRAENLTDLIAAIQTHDADIGVALDGDADRLGLVTNEGQIIWPDRQMMAFAKAMLARHPNAPIVFDVKCSQHLARVIESFGGQPIMWQTGHSVIKQKMHDIGAPLAGEMSGHIFFADDWYGFDDGLFAGCRMLSMLSEQPETAHQFFQAFPDSIHTPELMIAIDDDEKFDFIAALKAEPERFEDAQIHTIDGLRVIYEDGWGLVRASNTTPNLTLRFEADSHEALARIQQNFKSVLLHHNAELDCPF